MRSLQRAPAFDPAFSHGVRRRERTISGVLPRAAEIGPWASARAAACSYAALAGTPGRGGKARTHGTCFSSGAAAEGWLWHADGRVALHLGDGTLLCDEQRTLWVIFGGARFQVPDAETAARLFGRAPLHVSSSALAHLGSVPRDGTLLREEGDTQVYVLLGGTKHKVSACIDPAHVLWPGALEVIP